MATLSKGYDLEYIWQQVDLDAAKTAAGYYLQASEGGGEPPGRWWGPGAQALGFSDGEVVEREPYVLLFGERKDPDGVLLGRPPASGKKAADILLLLLEAEPHATAERRRELMAEAARRARPGPLYFDLTLSLSKSISIFHASLGENVRLAKLAGDRAGQAYWEGLAGEMDAMIWRAVHAGFGYFQREAGYTRTGSHSRRVAGRETGQWHEADLVVAHWLQHTSRDGDMQLHVHSQIAHIARTTADGKWRAPDSYGYNEHVGAVGAVVSQHLEEALTARFGVGWVPREDGHGFEIAGISGEVMREFSTRRESISADLRRRARAFEARCGRVPSQRELARLAQASNFATRARKEAGPVNADARSAGWADRLARSTGTSLASVAPSVWGQDRQAGAAARADGAGDVRERELTGLDVQRAGQMAVALAQRERSTFTRADVIKYLGRALPRTGLDPDRAARLLERVADRALRGEFEPLVCVEAPEPVQPPAALLRADGRSVYQRHGGIRYATHVQLALEERLVAQARAEGAPAMTREDAARVLGASAPQLDAALTQPASAAGAGVTQEGLRVDHAAAAYAAVTEQRRVSVINAPAGSGKTTVLTIAGQAWKETSAGRVIGVTPSQSARNTLAAGVPASYNSAQFLGDLPGQPGVRGPVHIQPGDLVLLDEASMQSTRHIAAVVNHAERSGAKVIVAGDTEQLQAVEDGGGLGLLAGKLGFVQLAEPVRFAHEWERAASLRLRAGDTSVLAEYDEHGRITGGGPEEMMDAAARTYVALTLEGKDVLLMAADHARRRELSRRIRDDLIHLGLVSKGPAVRLACGSMVSAGDLIVCNRNDHDVEAGTPGRTLANGDLLRVEAITGHGLMVRRAIPAGPAGGGRRWTGRSFLYGDYHDSELGYAVTDHVAQSRTVDVGLALISGLEDRQHAYVAMSRGRERNTAYVLTMSPKIADPKPGARAAPEIARYDKIRAERTGQPDQEPGTASGEGAAAIGVLADVLARDGQELSALQVLERGLSDADHLAILHAIWIAETTPARDRHYRDLLTAVLPGSQRQTELGSQARWLWRTLRAAELAGLDPAQVLREAAGQRSLADAENIAAVIDSRIRKRTRSLVPQQLRAWTDQVPQFGDPDRQDYITQIAQLMDERKERIGEHAARHQLSWAVGALGPMPDDPAGRLGWQQRASSIGAYRELYGYQHPTEPIGPEPIGDSPDKRAAWHEAFAALGTTRDAQVRGMTDGTLLHLRETYPAETAWAPPWVGGELRQVRLGAAQSRLEAIRAQAEAAAARTAGLDAVVVRHESLRDSYRAMAAFYAERETLYAGIMDDRRAWEQITCENRRLAVAADAELRRRHPDQPFPPLKSAEPEPATAEQIEALSLQPGDQLPGTNPQLSQLTASRLAFASQLALRTDQVRSEPDPTTRHSDRQPLLQPPKAEIPPSQRVLERAGERQAGREAGG